MKCIVSIVLFLFLTTVGATPYRQEGDTCHVYVVDVKAAEKLLETDLNALAKKSKKEQEAISKSLGLGKEYDEFVTKVGEEELTTKSYPFPKGHQIITASVFYTDESMASNGHSNSMLLAVSVGAKSFQNAINAPDAAIAEVAYDDHTDVVRVKKNVIVEGRSFVVGLQCKCRKK